jgi:hypothetical protein
MENTETVYLPLREGISARLEIRITEEPAAPTPNEREIHRAPTASELDAIADGMKRRVYQFQPLP